MMSRATRFALMSLLPPLLWGCCEKSDTANKTGSDQAWSDQQEEIHQLRELIRYEDETERQRRAELEALALPIDATTPAKAVVPAGEGQDQAHQ
jgi:hypothetical protein